MPSMIAAFNPHTDIGLLFKVFGGACLIIFVVGLILAICGFLFLKVTGALLRKVPLLKRNESDADAVPEAVTKILQRKIPRTKVARFVDGLRTPLDGLRMLNAYPFADLWRYSVAPAICSFAVTSIVVAGLVASIVSSAKSLHEQFVPGWLGRILEFGAFGLMIAVCGGIAFLVWLILQVFFCGFFFSRLVVKVELRLGTPQAELKEAPIAQQIYDSVIDILRFLVISLGLIFLNIVPLLGTAASFAGTLMFDCMFAGYEFTDYPLVVRGIRRRERRTFARKHRYHTLGLGAAVLSLILIPGLGAILLCTAAVGSSLLRRRLLMASDTDEISG